ncbi:hypothetical protein M8C21_008910, partial [Ambrosia artemisiifolia]
ARVAQSKATNDNRVRMTNSFLVLGCLIGSQHLLNNKKTNAKIQAVTSETKTNGSDIKGQKYGQPRNLPMRNNGRNYVAAVKRCGILSFVLMDNATSALKKVTNQIVVGNFIDCSKLDQKSDANKCAGQIGLANTVFDWYGRPILSLQSIRGICAKLAICAMVVLGTLQKVVDNKHKWIYCHDSVMVFTITNVARNKSMPGIGKPEEKDKKSKWVSNVAINKFFYATLYGC